MQNEKFKHLRLAPASPAHHAARSLHSVLEPLWLLKLHTHQHAPRPVPGCSPAWGALGALGKLYSLFGSQLSSKYPPKFSPICSSLLAPLPATRTSARDLPNFASVKWLGGCFIPAGPQVPLGQGLPPRSPSASGTQHTPSHRWGLMCVQRGAPDLELLHTSMCVMLLDDTDSNTRQGSLIGDIHRRNSIPSLL